MIVVRFRVRCRPDMVDEVRTALGAVIAPARAVEGVISFDIAQDLADPTAFVAVEVFEDRDALDRQESLPEVARVLALLPDAVVEPPEATLFEVASSAPHG